MWEIKKTYSKYFLKGGCYEINWYSDGSSTKHFVGISKILTISSTQPQEFLKEFMTIGFSIFEQIKIEMFFCGRIVKWEGFISSEALEDPYIIEAIKNNNTVVLAIDIESTDVNFCKVREQNYHINNIQNDHKPIFSNNTLYKKSELITRENDVSLSSNEGVEGHSEKDRNKEIKMGEDFNGNWDYNGDSISNEVSTKESKRKPSCLSAIMLLVVCFIIVGAVLSPFSSLGFLLYPIWVGGTILLAKFFEKNFLK